MKLFQKSLLCVSLLAGLLVLGYVWMLNDHIPVTIAHPNPSNANTSNPSRAASPVSHKVRIAAVHGTSRTVRAKTESSTSLKNNNKKEPFGRHLAEKNVWNEKFVRGGRTTSMLKRSPSLVVPNIVHYVWIGHNPLRFHHMLAMISAYKFIKPDMIMLHCDQEPLGEWWQLVKKNITTLKILRMTAPRRIFGNPVYLPEHQSDVVRIEALMKYGGIYLDCDVFVLKSFEELRHYEYTMGIEYHSPSGKAGRLNSGIIVANRMSRFLRLWHESFHYFNANMKNWDHQCCVVPYYMQYEFPELIHVEEKTLNYPSGLILKLIYDEVYDWSHNYAMHLWFRNHKKEHSPEDIKRMNTTFGQMARYIYYDSKNMIK